jgi:hypothetical protein
VDDNIVLLEVLVEIMNTLRTVLQDYEVASGKKVNLQKSSIFFGDGYTEERKDELKQALGVESEALSEGTSVHKRWWASPRMGVFNI